MTNRTHRGGHVPGANAVAMLHDTWWNTADNTYPWLYPQLFGAGNAPSMVPAVAITYGAALNASPANPLEIIDRVR